MIKTAIIGAGMIAASAHIPAYQSRGDVFKLAAVADVNLQAAQSLAAEHGIEKAFENAEQMLNEVQPQLVSICVPNAFHYSFTKLALAHGANVLCEKPLAFTYAQAAELFSLAKAKGLLLMACQSMRYTPDRLAAKAFIGAGNLGQPYYAGFSRIRRRGIPYWSTFHMKKFSCGGAFCDIGVHMLDAVLWLMGNPQIQSVSGQCGKHHANELGDLAASGARTGNVQNMRKFNPNEMDVEDFAAGTITFKNGCTLHFTTAWAANMPESSDIRIVGEKAGLDVATGTVYQGESSNTQLEFLPDEFKAQAFPGHFHIINNLAEVLQNGAQPDVLPEQTIQVSAVIGMFYRSCELGRPVLWEEILND